MEKATIGLKMLSDRPHYMQYWLSTILSYTKQSKCWHINTAFCIILMHSITVYVERLAQDVMSSQTISLGYLIPIC